MARQPYGTGSLFERKTGPRAGWWTKRYRIDGRVISASWDHKPTRAELTAKLAELSSTSRPRPPGESVAAYLSRWLRDGTSHLRERTVRGYRVLVLRSIAPTLGPVPLHELSAPDVQRWVNAGASRNALACLRAALSEAVRWGVIPVNPARAVRPLPVRRKQPTVLSPDEMRNLLAQVKDDPLEALFTLAAFTGMRQGEILGLRWQDVSLTNGSLTVSRSLWWMPSPNGGRQPVLTEPKTERSRRRIALHPQVVEALRKHQKAQMLASKDGLVFTRPDGTALEPSSVYRALRRHQAAAGVPVTTFHAIRHAAASMLIASGWDIAAVSELLGHSSTYTTLAIYTHSIEKRRRETMERMGSLLSETG